jgi:trimethylamine:corrinoid methyltransferase-like protein
VAVERLKTFSRDVRFAVLENAEEDLVHDRSLEVLERAGVSTTNDALLQLSADHGQDVDVEAKRIRVVEEKLAMVPRTFTLAARDRELDMVLDGERRFLGTDGCPADVIDLDTKKQRRGTKQDLADLTRSQTRCPRSRSCGRRSARTTSPCPCGRCTRRTRSWSARPSTSSR